MPRRASEPVFDEAEDKTTAFSVATLRDLVARSAEEHPAPRPSDMRNISPSKPAFLEKSGAILVLAESSSPTTAQPVAAPVAPIAPVAEPAPPEPLSIPPVPPPVASHRRLRVRLAGRPQERPTATAFLRCRLTAMALLAVVVASQPWWWDVGDLRSPPLAPGRASALGASR